MEFLTPLMSIIESSYNFIAKRINHLVNFNQRTQKMLSKLEELRDTRDDLKKEIERAELVGSISSKQVHSWLNKVDKIETEVNLFNAEHTLQVGKCFSKSSLCSSYKLSKKALEKAKEIDDLINKKAALEISGFIGFQQIDPMPNRPTIGLDKLLGMSLESIADDGVAILAIYGLGGVGKTTLLKEINNEYISRAYDFEAVIWVTVSREFGMERIHHDLYSRLRLPWEESDSMERRGLKIYKIMSRIKFLLLLDDVWQGLDFEKIGIPLPNNENKCKVVFTTRSLDVCSDMDATKKLRVDFLSEEDSWQLFCDKVGDTDIKYSHIKPYAQEIVRKCGGLPLALITMGRAMANRKTEEEWKYAIEVLNDAPSELRGMEDVFALLNFSYENLKDSSLKKCFLYCALFPEDYPLEKEQLIDYWIGQGFLDDTSEGSIYNKGHAIIGSLKVACLIETSEDEVETLVRMHDVVRSFALWVASSGGKSKEKFLLQGSPKVEKWGEAERICLVDGEVTMLSGSPVCPNLSTLLLKWNFSLSQISNDFFQFMPTLRVLDLSVTGIREIPQSIGYLVELCHLDLSRTKITTLPKELGCLSKLRHLDLQRTHLLQSVPKEVILGLWNLRILNLYCSYGEWEIPICEDIGEATIQDLQHLNYLNSLGITVTEHSALKMLSGIHNLLDIVEQLYINGCEGLVYAMIASINGGGERLRKLSIYNCSSLKEIDLGSEPNEDWLPSFEVLVLHTLPNLSAIWRKTVTEKCHRNLHYISIWHCPKLKNISWIVELPSLEKLYIFYCEVMEEIIGDNEVEASFFKLQFPKLKAVSFRSLPKLRSISKVAISFPVLQTIALIDCPMLRKIPYKDDRSSNLPIVYCSREWWDDLEWDDDTASSALHPQFIASDGV